MSHRHARHMSQFDRTTVRSLAWSMALVFGEGVAIYGAFATRQRTINPQASVWVALIYVGIATATTTVITVVASRSDK